MFVITIVKINMSLKFTYQINETSIIVSESITENEINKNKHILANTELEILNKFNSTNRQCEFLTSRIILRDYFQENITINYINKKPILKNKINVSISHKQKYVCVALNPFKEIGIDIEEINDKILKIENKFVCIQEKIKNLNSNSEISKTNYLTYLWTAKEATFKCLQNQDNIFIKDIEVELLNLNEGLSKINNENFKLDFIIFKDKYIICHAQKLLV